MKNREELWQRIRRSELNYCASHPVYFVEHYVNIEDKDAPGVVIPFRLWEGQKNAVESMAKNRFNIVLKARQLGISWLVLAMAAHMLLTQEGCTVIALSRTENEAMELVRRMNVILTHMPEFIAEKPTEGKRTITGKMMQIKLKSPEGGPESVFQAFTSSPSAARSFTANLIIFDEWAFQQSAEEIWTSGFPTINRPTGGKVIGLSTMLKGTLFERLWVENEQFNKVFLPWSTDPRRDAAWYESTRNMLGEMIYQEYPATPEEALMAPGGCFFQGFRREIHVIEPFPIPEGWRRYHAIDYGLDMLASLWAAVDDEGKIYVYREVYESELIVPRAAEEILAAEDEGERIHARFAPPDLFGRSSETGRTRIESFAAQGLSFEKSSNDREAGWMQIAEYLRIYTDAEGRRTARLKIFANCVNLTRTLSAIARDKRNPNDCAREPHELTHAPDALRYLIMGRPVPQLPQDRSMLREYEEAEDLLNFGC